MNIKPLPLLVVGALGFAAGAGLCWQITGRSPFRPDTDRRSGSAVAQSYGSGGVCTGLLEVSGESFEQRRPGEGAAILLAAMSGPSTTMRELGIAVESVIERAGSTDTPLRARLELLRAAATKLIERAGATGNPEDLAGLFGMREWITELHADLANKTAAALLDRIKKVPEGTPAGSIRSLAGSGEWRDFTVVARLAPAGWEVPEEIGEGISDLFDRAEKAIPSRDGLGKMLPEEAPSPDEGGGGKGAIEAVKTGLSARVREVTGDEVISIPEVLADPALSERYKTLADSLVAALRECEAVQLKAYNLWALDRIHAAETSPTWESTLAAVDTAFLQSVVASLYADVSGRKLNAEQEPVQRAAKVRVMVRQKKLKPADF